MTAATAILFDLDDTLMPDAGVAAEAFLATAHIASTAIELDATRLAEDARTHARALWRAAPVHSYCLDVGISSWEGLWCLFEGDHEAISWLRAWSPSYRRDTWVRALADQGIDDRALAELLGDRFAVERRARHRVYPEAPSVLDALAADRRLALVTNGAACLQREKLHASGLAGYFDVVLVSADIGTGKPARAVFDAALHQLGVNSACSVMVGDSMERDIHGALAAGLEAVHVDRSAAATTQHDGFTRISSLEDLHSVL